MQNLSLPNYATIPPSKGRYTMWLDAEQSPSDIWTITDLSRYIRELFEIDFRLQDVQVEGEISNFTRARSGHLYFTLKDANAQIRCAMWRNDAQRLNFQPQDGDAIIARGRISVYEARGDYQLYVTHLQNAGIGDLALAFAQLKDKLAAAGLFDPDHKQPIPQFPQKIGIVTSADAAALRDILHVLRRRYPLVSVLISPTLVQGKEAPAQIVQALNRLATRDDIDTIILARGGGSIEDLWAFNDEQVAHAIYATPQPIIAGIGHETDFTIADFVADVRAPTPSAAAELAVPNIIDLVALLDEWQDRLTTHMMDYIQTCRQYLQTQQRTLALLHPQTHLNSQRQYLDTLTLQLEQAIQRHLQRVHTQYALAQTRLQAVSPLATLARGYALVRHIDGQLVRHTQDVKAGDTLQVQLSDGTFTVTVSPEKQ